MGLPAVFTIFFREMWQKCGIPHCERYFFEGVVMAVSQRGDGWQARIRRHGWPAQTKTFRLKSDAEAWARATEREMDVGAFISRDDAERTTFQQAAERYAREVLPRLRAQVQPRYMLLRLCEHFGRYSLASISSAMLAEYRDARLKVVSPQTVVHELGLISRVFKAAALDWGIALPQGIPTALVRKPKVSNARERRLEGREEALLLDALAGKTYPLAAVILALETAARQSELASLQWVDVDLVRRFARLRGPGGRVTKSGDDYRDVPLSSRAVDVLKALPRLLKDPRVFPLSQNALRLSWDRALVSARKRHLHARLATQLDAEGIDGAKQISALVYKKREPEPRALELLAVLEQSDQTLVDLHFHDLRHEATSRLAERLQMHELMKVTGHKSSSMLSRYYHPRAEDLAAKLG